jgi:multisubunit Na+/H+ antiporter MnhG subunit
MEKEIRDLAINAGILGTGIWARAYLGGKKYSFGELTAFVGIGVAIIAILSRVNIWDVYKMTIILFYGLVAPNLLSAIFKAANRSEDKAAKKLSDYIDKKTNL